MATNNKPVAELRIGTVKATVWENEVGGITRHNVIFSRLYRDEEQWKTTHSFGFERRIFASQLHHPGQQEFDLIDVPRLPFLCPSARAWQVFPGSRP